MKFGWNWNMWSPCVSTLTFVLVCFLLAGSLANGHEEHVQDIKKIQLMDVCANRQMPIVSVQMAKDLIAQVEMDPEMKLCESKYRSAFFELKTVLDSQQDVCGELKFERIKQFHFRYIRPPTKEVYPGNGDLNHLEKRPQFGTTLDGYSTTHGIQLDEYYQELWCPAALQSFFTAYVLQVSGIFKQTFADNLEKSMQKLDDDDHAYFDVNVIGAPGSDKMKKSKSKSDKESDEIKSEKSDDDEVDEKMNKEKDENENDAETGVDKERNKIEKGDKKKKKTKDKKIKKDKKGKKDKESKEDDNTPNQIIPALRVATTYEYDLTYGRLVYLPELEGEKEEGDLERMKRVTRIDLRDNPGINKFMHACEKHFKPIYSKLIMPIVRLAKLDYEYCGPQIDKESKQLESEMAMIWLAVTMACEQHGKIELVGDEFKDMKQVEYSPLHSYKFEDLWIKGPEAVRDELARTKGYRSKGLEKFLFNSARTGRIFMAAIDPQRSQWYRRNQNTVGSGLNVVSILSNAVSVAVTFIGG